MGFLSANYPGDSSQEGWCYIGSNVARLGNVFSTFAMENGFRTKIEELRCKQVDDFGFDVAVT